MNTLFFINGLFISISHMGKRLILKCRKLLQENEELGKMISSENLAKLEADLAYHKALLTEACENEQSKPLSCSLLLSFKITNLAINHISFPFIKI